MKARRILRYSLLVPVGLFLASSYASPQVLKGSKPAINVKLGLWEQTTVVQLSGMPAMDPADTAKMTPEQRQRMEAMMKSTRQRMATPHTVRTCLTKEKLEKSLFEENDSSCKNTVVTNTPRVYEVKSVCSGRRATSSEWRFEALTPETVKGSGKITTEENKMTSTATMSGKWIAASCGDVK